MTHWTHIDAPDPRMVVLTPTHFFDDFQHCWTRKGSGGQGWRQTVDHAGPEVLMPEVYWWLRENVGFEMNEVWDVDRFFYPDEERPELPKGAGAAWRRAGRESFYGHQRGEYSYHRGRQIYFPELEHAMAFRARFSVWHDTWDAMTKAAHRRYSWEDRKLAAMVRKLDRVPFGIASHALRIGDWFKPLESLGFISYARDHPDYGKRRFYFLDSDEDRVMFKLSCQAEDPQVYLL